MYSYTLTLTPHLKRIDCKFYDPKEKKINLNSSTEYIFDILDKFVTVSGGKRLPKGSIPDINGIIYKIPYVRVEDLNNKNIDFEQTAKISEEDYNLIKNYDLQSEDICLSNVGTIGTVGYVDKECICSFSENLARLRVKNNTFLYPKYLFYYLLSDFAQVQFNKNYVGSLQYKLSLSSIKSECKIIMPLNKDGSINYNKQKEIVKKIDAIINQQLEIEKTIRSKIFEYNKYLEKVLNIKDFTGNSCNSYNINLSKQLHRIDALYSNPIHNELKGYLNEIETISLKECLELNTKQEKTIKEFYNVIDLENIDEDLGVIKNYKDVTMLNSQKIKLEKNNIIIPKMQTDKNKVALVSLKYDNMCGSSEFLQYSIKDGFEKNYILAALRTAIVKKQWEFSITGSSRMRINKDIIMNTSIPYPKDNVFRKKIVTNLELMLNEIQEMKKLIKDKRVLITQLFCDTFHINISQ